MAEGYSADGVSVKKLSLDTDNDGQLLLFKVTTNFNFTYTNNHKNNGDLLGIDFPLDKKERIATFASGSSHAMTLMAVDLDAEGKPLKWMVENSWGASSGYQGHLIMTDEWFDEYMFRLVVEKKYATEKVLKACEQKPILLPCWDPMFAAEE